MRQRGVTVAFHSPDRIEYRACGGHSNAAPSLTYDQALAAGMKRRPQMRLHGLTGTQQPQRKAVSGGNESGRQEGRHWSGASCKPLSEGQGAGGVTRDRCSPRLTQPR